MVSAQHPPLGEHPEVIAQDSHSDVQFGSLILKVDHFLDEPLEWLAQSGIDIQEVNDRAARFAQGNGALQE